MNKSFQNKIIWFLLPVLVVWLSTEIFYRTTATNYTVKAKNVVARYPTTEILVFGDSHALYGINPTYFERETFNIANISQSLYFDELLLEKHLEKHQDVKAIVLNISYFTLSQKENSLEDAWRKYFYDQQMDLDVPTVSFLSPKKYSLALARRFKKSVVLMHEYHKNGTIVGCTETGYGLQDARDIVSNKEETSKLIAKKHEDGSLDFSNNIARLERMIKKCKDNGVRVFLIEMPVHKTYYSLLNQGKKEKINSSCTSLATRFENTYFFDYSIDPAFIDADLRDADHLTNEGAAKFSKRLNDQISEVLQPKKE